MQRSSVAFVRIACIAAWLAASGQSFAQFGTERFSQPFGQPAFSPYLNLLGNSGNTGINYFGLVRPQQQFFQQSEELRQGLYSPAQRQGRNQSQFRQNGMRSPMRLGTTGHPTSFRSLGTASPQGADSAEQNSGSRFGGQNSGAGGGAGNQPGAGRYSGHSSGFNYGTAYGSSRRSF